MGAVVDTNFLVRLIVGEPIEQASEALGIVESVEAGSLLVDRIVIAETLYVLKSNYQLSRQVAVTALTQTLQQRAFSLIDTAICLRALNALRQTVLSPEDAFLAAMVGEGRATAAQTFDRGLLKYISQQAAA